jgi:hypothetical protein
MPFGVIWRVFAQVTKNKGYLQRSAADGAGDLRTVILYMKPGYVIWKDFRSHGLFGPHGRLPWRDVIEKANT